MTDRDDRSQDDRTEPSELLPTIDLDVGATRVTPPRASSSPADPPTGELIGGRYRVLSTLGIGGMGVVYRVHDTVLDVELALKMLRGEIAQDADFLQRFRNELLTARQVTHRHVVRNHDIGTHEGGYFLTMDLIPGRSLQDVLAKERKLAPERVVAIVRQIAAALAEAHRQGIVHRDLKPANVLIDEEGDAYITDFGIARSLSADGGFTRTGEVIGSPDYLSPEQARGEKVDGRSDLYSLGLMMIELLSGKLPFRGGTIFEVLSQHMQGQLTSLEELGLDVSPGLRAVIENCVEKDPADRYASAEELLADLDALERRPRRLTRRQRRRSAAAAAGAATLALVVLTLWRWAPWEDAADWGTDTAAVSPAGEVAPPRHAVAVLPWRRDADDGGLAWASAGVAEMLATALAESGDLRVVDSVRVAQNLDDLGFDPERLRPEEVAQLAEFLQVDRVVSGTLRSSGGEVQLEMRLLAADEPGASPRVVATRQGRVEEIFDLVGELGASLRESLAAAAPAETPAAPSASAAALRAYSEGLAALSQGESLKALPALERAVEEDPGFTHAWVRLSQAYQDLGRPAEALEASGRAVAAAAGGRIAYEARAQEALLRGDPERAQAILEELVARYPNDAAARIALAEAYGEEGKIAEAAARLEGAVALDPSEPRAWYLLGRFAIMTGDIRRAVDDYLTRALVQQKRLGNEQGQAEIHNALGVAYQRLGRIDEAVASYRTAAEIRERLGDRRGQAVTLHNLAFLQLHLGEHAAAEENIRQALAIHTELGNAAGIGKLTNTYGLLQEERGRYAEALEHYRQSLQVRGDLGDDRGLAEGHANVGYAYYLLGQYDNALLHLDRALGIYDENQDRDGRLVVLPSLGLCRLAQGDWTAAVAAFLEALELSRELGSKEGTAILRGNLGQVAQYQGRYAAALEAYDEARGLLADLGNRRALAEIDLRQAEALLELGARERARERLDEVASNELSRRHPAQRARLRALESDWHLGRGEADDAARLAREALAAARETGSPALVLAAEIALARAAAAREPGRALGDLAAARAEAERLGDALLELRAAEALAAAALAAGDARRAEEALDRALAVVEKTGAYARAFRLHQLRAEALASRGAGAEAVEARRQARAASERVREGLDEALRRSFDRLPEVRALSG